MLQLLTISFYLVSHSPSIHFNTDVSWLLWTGNNRLFVSGTSVTKSNKTVQRM